jgi:hypothetical protein
MGTAATDPAAVGWYRLTDAKPCPFCALLASRGIVYKQRGIRPASTAPASSHNDCGCSAEPAFTRDHQLPAVSTEAARVVPVAAEELERSESRRFPQGVERTAPPDSSPTRCRRMHQTLQSPRRAPACPLTRPPLPQPRRLRQQPHPHHPPPATPHPRGATTSTPVRAWNLMHGAPRRQGEAAGAADVDAGAAGTTRRVREPRRGKQNRPGTASGSRYQGAAGGCRVRR